MDEQQEIGGKRVVRSVTILAHPAVVEQTWNDWLEAHAKAETRQASISFSPAPGARGTELKAELIYHPKGGKLGTAIARLTHSAPAQELAEDLHRFKQTMEIGEILLSDATVRPGMHPAQPEGVERAS
jgi:uncharacterized membrane protein